MATTQQIMDALFEALDSGAAMHEIMRNNERSAGYRVVIPGDETWLSADDWHPTVTVSVDGQTVRLVAMLANNPGGGALKRTVRAILSAGMVPCIIEPSREMRETMKRWNWYPRRVGSGMESEEQWRPRKTFSI